MSIDFIHTEYFSNAAISVLCGIIGAETRIALEQVGFTKDPLFHKMKETDRKKVPFRPQRWLIGIVSAYIGVVTLGTFMPIPHAIVVALLASLGGNSFLKSRMENSQDGEHYQFLKLLAEQSDKQVITDFHEIAALLRRSGVFAEHSSGEES
ncbi:MAG: hypothetical protein K6T83_01285 [Alicyclobacillus sp.]|nr:hypothetical protein [Alicyclobacillus sp.]